MRCVLGTMQRLAHFALHVCSTTLWSPLRGSLKGGSVGNESIKEFRTCRYGILGVRVIDVSCGIAHLITKAVVKWARRRINCCT